MRKLATAAISASATVFAAHRLAPDILIIAAAASTALSLASFFFKGALRLRLAIICMAMAVGFAASYVSFAAKVLPARELSDTEMLITATVTDYPTESKTRTCVPIRLTGGELPHLNALLFSYENELSELAPGDELSVQVRIKSADLRYGEDYGRYNAENVYLLCYVNGEIEQTGRSPLAFLYFPKTIAKAVKAVALDVFSPTAAPLLTALLTGDTNLLYDDPQLYADMCETGILHVVSVSGMHVAFLVGFVRLLVRRKKWASAIAIPLVWLFVPIAGASPSVIRAAFMQSMVLLAPLFGRENDGMTSLSAVLAALLLINPDACKSVSLQLSFAAMLGIILITPRVYRALLTGADARHKSAKKKATLPVRVKDKILLAVCASLASTIGALTFSAPIAALYFGYVSLIGIVVNLLTFWLFSASFILGYVSCFLGMLWLPVGAAMGAVTSVLTGIIISVVRAAASVPYAAIYTEGSVFGWWLLLVYGVFILCFFRRGGERPRAVIPVCLAACSLCAVIVFSDLRLDRSPGTVTAVDVGQGQSIIMTSGRATAVIDCGGKAKLQNAGETVAARLLREGRQSVDVLALTHFDDDHVNGVIRLMSRVEVKRLVIPPDSFDKAVRYEILDFAESCGTEVYIISEDTSFHIGDMNLTAIAPVSERESALMLLGSMGDFELLATGDASAADERRLLKHHTLPDAELFVAGHHGSKHASSAELLAALQAEYAVVSVGYNSYGHPTPETLSRFADAGMTVMRTDELGDIRFCLERGR